MSIRPIDLNGMVQQSVDIGTIKQNENQKPIFDQTLLAAQTDKKAMEKADQVNETKDKADAKGNFDARDESQNKYEFLYGKDKKKKKKNNGSVKKLSSDHGFDIRI